VRLIYKWSKTDMNILIILEDQDCKNCCDSNLITMHTVRIYYP